MSASPALAMGAPWRSRLAEWARLARPREACGLLLGTFDRDGAGRAAVQRAVWARNLSADPDRFELDPAAHLTAERAARLAGLEVIGAWHAHPRGSAEPSRADRRAAHGGWWCLIVGADLGLAAWWAPASGRLVPGTLVPPPGPVPGAEA